jgi:hypothetical protein
MLAIYATLNTAVAPLLDAAPREYLGRVMAVFSPLNQLASMVSVVVSGWLTSTVLRSFRASFAGVTLNSVSLIFLVAAGLIFVSGIGVPVVLGKLWSDIGCSQGKSRTRHGILGGG